MPRPTPPPHPAQYIFPFGAPQDELLARLRMLRSTYLGLSRGRQEGVIQLLERLVVLANDLGERPIDTIITNRDGQSQPLQLERAICIRKSMMALAAGITGRSVRSERTIARWRADAEAVGSPLRRDAQHLRQPSLF